MIDDRYISRYVPSRHREPHDEQQIVYVYSSCSQGGDYRKLQKIYGALHPEAMKKEFKIVFLH